MKKSLEIMMLQLSWVNIIQYSPTGAGEKLENIAQLSRYVRLADLSLNLLYFFSNIFCLPKRIFQIMTTNGLFSIQMTANNPMLFYFRLFFLSPL